MDLKEKLQDITSALEIRHFDKRLIISLGLLGLFIMALAIWLALTDWRIDRESAQALREGQAAVDQLLEPVQALDRVFQDEQVSLLAARAIQNPDALADLNSYLTGRISEIREAQVFGSNLDSVDPVQLGSNGFAIYDMLLNLKDEVDPRLQIHHIVQPPVMVDAVRINAGDELAGYMVVSLDPDFVLSHFDPDYSGLGYIGLSQYNGRQQANKLGSVGDPSLVGEIPDRQSIPGTLMRIEFPQPHQPTLLGTGRLLLILLVGLLFLASAVLMHRNNKRLDADKSEEKSMVTDDGVSETVLTGSPDSDFEKQEPGLAREPEPEPAMDTERSSALAGRSDTPPQEEHVESESPLMHLRYDIAERRRLREPKHKPVELTSGIFRAYDIRGVLDKTLDAGVAKQIGQAVGTVTLERDAGPVVVARDGRISGPYLQDGMIEGILSTGCDVLDIGAVPTGVLYYATHEMAAGSGVMITGSHNPPDYNGFKIMVGGDTLHGKEISALYDRITEGNIQSGTGAVKSKDVVQSYIDRIAGDIQLERPLRIVIDCGNGIGGVCAAEVLRAIGAEVLPLFDEVDGTFPNHHPDPSEPENLQDLIESVRLMDADLGLALDGDADRLGVVTLAGNIIFPDRVMMLLAMDVLDRNPGATIIYDVKCTGHLADVIRQAGGEPMMYKTGHSLIKAKMKEVGAPFAGEMSGHFFFEERWYGVDDGIYSAARLLEILAGAETPPEAILNALPTSFSTPELKVQMTEGENFAFIEEFIKVARFDGAKIATIDGIRADFPDGWGLVRCSNTTPILVVRFDAETEEALERIKTSFRSQMLAVKPDLELPF
jgi:phosphomannomutase/phosphoglucomutase